MPVSQSLSGWDGVFHLTQYGETASFWDGSQSLSGWDGVFHDDLLFRVLVPPAMLSQSLSGWDGVFHRWNPLSDISRYISRNPFQGGMGFFTCLVTVGGPKPKVPWSQSLSGWDGVFHRHQVEVIASA